MDETGGGGRQRLNREALAHTKDVLDPALYVLNRMRTDM